MMNSISQEQRPFDLTTLEASRQSRKSMKRSAFQAFMTVIAEENRKESLKFSVPTKDNSATSEDEGGAAVTVDDESDREDASSVSTPSLKRTKPNDYDTRVQNVPSFIFVKLPQLPQGNPLPPAPRLPKLKPGQTFVL